MARLIDADALNKELQKRVGSPTDDKLYEVNLCIINAPTINAIPVKWLEDRIYDMKRAPLYRRYTEMLLIEWLQEQKEQEGEIVAEYNDVIKQFKRMCGYYNKILGKRSRATQTDCPLRCKGYDGCNISDCRKLAFDDKNFQNVVMTWAETHKEPVYPTWYRWLTMMGAVTSSDDLWMDLQQTIPSDIAQKLGIEPK